MAEAHELAVQMERAYARGDHHTARMRAHELAAVVSRGPGAPSEQAELAVAAHTMLRRTAPDIFLMLVGALGLGAMVWLFYAYVL